MIKLGLFQGWKDSSIYANQLIWYTILTNWKIKKHIISIDAEKAFDKIQHVFIIKTLQKMGIEGTYLNVERPYMISLQQTLFSLVKNWKHSPLRSGARQGCPLSLLLFSIVLEVLATAIREDNEIKWIQIGTKEVRLSLFSDDRILYIEIPKDAIRKLLELISEFSKVSGLKNQFTENTCTSIYWQWNIRKRN